MIRKNDYPYRPETAVQKGNSEDRLLKNVLFLGILSIFLICAYHLLTHCEYFRLENITVSGNRQVSAEEIRCYAGIQEGMNLLAVNIFLSRKRLLANPWVAESRIMPVFPRGIRIEIREHLPLAVFDMGRLFIVNGKGRIFKEFQSGDPSDLPRVSGLKFTDITDSDTGEPFRAVMTVLGSGQAEGNILPLRMIREIRVDRETGVSLRLSEKYRSVPVEEIRLGYHSFSEKYRKLQKLFAYMKKNSGMPNIRSIDLTHSDRIAVNPDTTEALSMENKEV